MFNALKYTQELEKAGFSRDQAEASVKLLIEVMNENFATKADLSSEGLVIRAELNETAAKLSAEIQATRTDLSSELHESVLRLDASIREVEYKMTIELGAMMTLAIGVTATLVRLLQNVH